MGWSAAVNRQTTANTLDLRLTHAPGGNAAFARATDEYTLSLSQRIARTASLTAVSWGSSDGLASTRFGTTTQGGALGMQFNLGSAVNASINARDSRYTTTSTYGAVGSSERGVSGALGVRRARLFAAIDGGAGTVLRSTTISDQALADRGVQGQLHGSAGLMVAGGSVEVVGAATRGVLGDVLTQSSELGARAENIRLVSMRYVQLFANGAVQRLTWLDGRSTLDTYTGGISARLPQDLKVTVEAERNPFLAPSTPDAGRWFLNLRVEHALRLPTVLRPATHGLVFRDLNGNGVRDANEGGFPGIVVRGGGSPALTRRDGSFSLPRSETTELRLDPLSIPAGWVAQSERLPAGTVEVGLVPVGNVRVSLRVAVEDSSRVSATDLESVTVFAIAENGRAWLASRPTTTTAVFDALPPGRYSLGLDAGALREPLKVDGGTRDFIVDVGHEQEIVVPLRPRPMRVRSLNGATAGPSEVRP
jgi:hypothetical protein